MTGKFENCTHFQKKIWMRDTTEKHLEQRLQCCIRVTFLRWRLLFCFQVERRIGVPLTTFWAWRCWISTVFFSFVNCFTQSLFLPSWKVTKRWKVARKPRTCVFFLSKNTDRNRNHNLFLLFENCGNFYLKRPEFSAFRTCPSPSTRS